MGRVGVHHPDTQRRKNWANTQAYILLKAKYHAEHLRNRERLRHACPSGKTGEQIQNWVASQSRSALVEQHRAEWDELLQSKFDEFDANYPKILAQIEDRRIAAFSARRPKVRIDTMLEVNADWIAQCRSGKTLADGT